jgi:predicted NAD/FAD-binding protein
VPERIAIVGAGVSGLVAAHLLRRRFDVTVFEAAAYAGGHTNTVRVDGEDGGWDVDTGFIVHNDRNYPRFQALLGELGVATQPSEMSFGVSDDAGGFEYNSASPNGLFATRRHLAERASTATRGRCSPTPATTARSATGSRSAATRARSSSG